MTGLAASSLAAYPSGEPFPRDKNKLVSHVEQERGHKRRLPPFQGGGSWEWGVAAVFDMGCAAPSSSEFQQGLSEALMKLKLTTGCLASPESPQSSPDTSPRGYLQ